MACLSHLPGQWRALACCSCGILKVAAGIFGAKVDEICHLHLTCIAWRAEQTSFGAILREEDARNGDDGAHLLVVAIWSTLRLQKNVFAGCKKFRKR